MIGLRTSPKPFKSGQLETQDGQLETQDTFNQKLDSNIEPDESCVTSYYLYINVKQDVKLLLNNI